MKSEHLTKKVSDHQLVAIPFLKDSAITLNSAFRQQLVEALLKMISLISV